MSNVQTADQAVSDPNDVPDSQSMTHVLNRHINQVAREELDHPIIGLSLSSCVRDIVTGLVDIKNVVKIVAGTKAETPADWKEVVESYQARAWYQFPDEAERIVRQLLSDGKIVQPRVSEHRCPVLAGRKHWVDAEAEIQYRSF